ncbi:UDP-N-acetylenolpyruvoylglucosamine reductase [mine drainage metagenome]|uniref:UDP-N-acetylmuramate dehydrogenase n=1 Tax=mine drainage metagenome TaxID=410659 RepID=A0A1J5TSF1_9ZZZZ
MNMNEPTQFNTEGLRGEMLHDEPMSRHTSWRAGGRAKRMYRPADLADLQRFLQLVPADEPLIAVGLGSNLLVRDGGLNGTVLLMVGALNELRMDGDNIIYAQAGVAGAKLARFAASNHLCGAEFFVGIPGTLGGMLAMNAGCYGGETWNLVRRVQVLTRRGELLERTAQDYEIGYRHVALRNAGNEFFVGAWLKLERGDVEAARKEIKALMEKRGASQPLQLPNAGSVFRNPPGGHAAKLIEGCGLKGRRVGGAQVSEKHANFIVNVGEATAADIESLIEEVRQTVLGRTGVELHPEVRIVGERI